MSERNRQIETSRPEDRYFERAKEIEKKATNVELEKHIAELTEEHDRLMDEWDKATLASQDEVAHQLLEDSGKILAELSRIDPQTKEEKELAKKRSEDPNSMEELKNQADELTKKHFEN